MYFDFPSSGLCWVGYPDFLFPRDVLGWDIQIFPSLWEPGLCSVSSTGTSELCYLPGEFGDLQAAGQKPIPIFCPKEPACSRALGGRDWIYLPCAQEQESSTLDTCSELPGSLLGWFCWLHEECIKWTSEIKTICSCQLQNTQTIAVTHWNPARILEEKIEKKLPLCQPWLSAVFFSQGGGRSV